MSGAIEGEGGAYVPCDELASPLPALPEGAIVGSGVGFVSKDMLASPFPDDPTGAIVGSGVGFVPKPCIECSTQDTFTRTVVGGLGTGEFDGTTLWTGGTGCSVSGGEAHLPTAEAPYFDPAVGAFTQPIEILTRQRIFRGTAPSSTFSGSPPGSDPQPTDRDVAARLEIRRHSNPFLNPIAWVGLLMDHGDHGGVLAADVQLELGYHDAFDTIATSVVISLLPTVVMTRFLIEPLSSGSSTIRAKAWAYGAAEPAWQLSMAASWTDGIPQPLSPAAMLMLDHRVGALDTIWHVDDICIVSGL